MTCRRPNRMIRALAPLFAWLVAACGATAAPPSTVPPAATPSPSAAVATTVADASPTIVTTSAAPSPSAPPDPLVGTWTTGEVTCDQWYGAIAKAYTPAQVAKYDKDPNTHQCPATFTIRFRGEHLVIFVNDEAGWDGLYRLKGSNEIEAGDNCAYCWLSRPAISGDRLTVDLITDGDAIDPVLDGIVQTGIYESTHFERVD